MSRWHKPILEASSKRQACFLPQRFTQYCFQIHRKQPNKVNITICFPWTESLSASVSIHLQLPMQMETHSECYLNVITL